MRASVSGGASAATTSDPNMAYPDTGLDAMFTNYADDSAQGSHWTGGDGTVSVQLPDGDDAWFFSDTFLGTVNSDGSRSWSTPFIHNDIVLQQGTVSGPTLTTVTGTDNGTQTSLVGAPADGYRQVDSAWVDTSANVVYAFYTDYSDPGAGGLDATPTATSIATFSLPDLTFEGLTTMPVQAGTLWGSAVLYQSNYTYIYGNGNNSLYVARAPEGEVIASGSDPAADWTYWTGSGWSSTEANAQPALVGVHGLSVAQVGSQYVLATFDMITGFDSNIVAYSAAAPYGPFTGKTYVYSAPPLDCDCYSYYPEFHQELASSGELVLSYNSNTLVPAENYADASIYQPRFIDVPWPQSALTPTTGVPTGLTATSTGAGMQLSWTAPSSSPTDYYVYAKNLTNGDSYPSRVTPLISQTSVTLNSLTNGDQYQFMVTSSDGEAESAPSASVTAVPTVAAPTQAPTGVTATAGTDGTVTVSWSAVANAAWYVVDDEDKTAGATSFSPSGLSTSQTSLVVSGLTVGHTYEFEVAAATEGGDGPFSSPASATSYEPPPPAPTGVTATANSDDTIGLSWTAISGAWYFVQTSSNGGQTWSPAINSSTIPTTTNSYKAEYLSVGTTYEFRVYATDSGGVGPASATVSAVAQMTPPPAPLNLRVSTDDSGNINVSWDAPAPGLYYFVYYQNLTVANSPVQNAFTEGDTSIQLQYLTVGDRYAIYVRATNAGGQGAATPTEDATPYVPPPGVPQGFTAVSGDGQVDLSWTDTAGDWYWVYYCDLTSTGNCAIGSANWTDYLAESNTTQVEYLDNGDEYQFYVEATNAGGVSAPSQVLGGWPQIPPPPTPTGVKLTANGNDTLSASWNAISGAWYWVTWEDVSSGYTYTAYVDEGNTASLYYLTIGDTYAIFITATNAGGLSPATSAFEATAWLAAPTDLVETPSGAAELAYQWRPGNSSETVFHVYWTGNGSSGNYYVYNADNGYLYGLPDENYAITVTAVGWNGGESQSVSLTARPEGYGSLTPQEQADEPPNLGQDTDDAAAEATFWALIWRPRHDTAVVTAAAEIQANHPECQVVTENGIPGGALTGNFGWADIVLWCADYVEVWEVKHQGDGAEAAGPAQLDQYMAALAAQLLREGDPRWADVDYGSPLGTTLGPIPVPNGTAELVTVMDGKSPGMIVYEVGVGRPPAPVPNPQPGPAPVPDVVPDWVTSRPLWGGLAVVAGGAAFIILVDWVLESLGVIVLA